jgi:hypothetical protein
VLEMLYYTKDKFNIQHNKLEVGDWVLIDFCYTLVVARIDIDVLGLFIYIYDIGTVSLSNFKIRSHISHKMLEQIKLIHDEINIRHCRR